VKSRVLTSINVDSQEVAIPLPWPALILILNSYDVSSTLLISHFVLTN